jgi:hypothetical protein
VCVGEGGQWRTCARRYDDEPRLVWTSVPMCVFITAGIPSRNSERGERESCVKGGGGEPWKGVTSILHLRIPKKSDSWSEKERFVD